VKILVVEDDRKLARFLQRVFSEEGYSADAAYSGTDAIERVLGGIYKLVVLDWVIPDLDGLEVCRELRRCGCNVPILMLTARCEPSERVICLRAGADDYLVKPFEVEELVARVTALLRRAAGSLCLTFGRLVVDREQRCVLIDGERIALTAREFQLLLHLAHRCGQVVTRSELLTEVWSTQFDPDSNVVEVHMSRLRDKLGDAADVIETVRGEGYRLRILSDT
jgi:DNA-binding response OmpR family regulator